MPFKLNGRDISADIDGAESVLIVPCRFCPAASLAISAGEPYIELFRHLLRTPSYEAYIQRLKSRLEAAGARTVVFDSRWPHQFVACMWTAGRRKALADQSARCDVVAVLGCDAAVETVRSCVPDSCRVVPGMEVEGIMNVIPRVRFPFDVSLELSGVTRVSPRPPGS